MLPSLLLSFLAFGSPTDSVWGRISHAQLAAYAKEVTRKAVAIPENQIRMKWGPFGIPEFIEFSYQGSHPYPYLIDYFDNISYLTRTQITWNGKTFQAIDSTCRVKTVPRSWDACVASRILERDLVREFVPLGGPSWKTLASFYLDYQMHWKNAYPLPIAAYSCKRHLDTSLMVERWTLSDQHTLLQKQTKIIPDNGFLSESIFIRKRDSQQRDTLVQEFAQDRDSPREEIEKKTMDEVRFGYTPTGRILWDLKSDPPLPANYVPDKGKENLIRGCLRRYHAYDQKGRDTFQVLVSPDQGILRGVSVLEYNNKNEIVQRTLGAINVTQNKVTWMRSERWRYDTLGRLTSYATHRNVSAWDTLSDIDLPVQLFPDVAERCEF